MKKVLLISGLLIVAVAGGIAAYTAYFLPNVGKPDDLKVDVTTERVARGAYLANHVAVCMDCHSTRDWSRFSGPVIAGTEGKGGEYFGPEMGFPGKFYSRNLTPHNLKGWTDGQIFRAITTGVDNDDKALFPVMPYRYYGKMDKEDIYDIIAYIRTLKPIDNTVPKRIVDFPMDFILNTIPEKAAFTQKPSKSDVVKYGQYLVNAAGCIECHTPAEKGTLISEKAFSGGRAFEFPSAIVYSANITPDKETGIGNWTAETFLAVFKDKQLQGENGHLKAGDFNSPMPWTMYAGMDSTDLLSIFAYLNTLQPIKNKVVVTSAKSK